MAGQTLSKTSFFAALERLDHLDDTDDEGDELSAGHVFNPIPMTPKALPALSPVVSTTKSSTPASLARAHSDPQSSACYERSQGLEPLKHVKGNDRRVISRQSNPAKPSSVQRSYTTGSMPGTKAAGPASKKRKVNSVKVVPEDKQIFKNLVFCECIWSPLPLSFSLTSQSSSRTTMSRRYVVYESSVHRSMVLNGLENGRQI